MKGIGLVPNWQKENTAPVVERISRFFRRSGIPLFIAGRDRCNFSTDTSLAQVLADWFDRVKLIIVVGGDGTILRAARDLAYWAVPILGINAGHKGFLAEIEVEQMERYLQQIISGRYDLQERMMLEAVVRRGEKELGSYLALNDMVVSRGPFSRIISLDTFINNDFLESYSGDGVVVASPTGSTGYSLSAGGPIVNPSLELMVITPICPHSLYNRSVIVTGSEQITLRVRSRQAQVVLTVDGQMGYALEEGDAVHIHRAVQRARLVCFADNSFYRLLNQKLKG